jgi:prevent-host-death family protein
MSCGMQCLDLSDVVANVRKRSYNEISVKIRRYCMSKRILKTKPQVIMKDGRPSAVIIDINDYRELLERLEDKEDLADLEKIRIGGGVHVRKFEDYLTEHNNAL